MNHRGRRYASGGLVVVVLAAVVAAFAVAKLDHQRAGGTHRKPSDGMSMGGSMGSMGGSMGSMGGSIHAKLLAKWGITPSAMAHMEQPTKAAWIPFAPTLGPHGWHVVATTAAPGHPASAVLGSQSSAYWQSVRLGRRTHLPEMITIRLASPELVAGIRYVPHVGLGEIGLFSVSVSSDGRHFGPAVAYGRWQANVTVKQVIWNARLVKAVRLTIKSVSPSSAASVAASKLLLMVPAEARSSTLPRSRRGTP